MFKIVGNRKPPLHLVPAVAEITESKHGDEVGAAKCGPFNWRISRGSRVGLLRGGAPPSRAWFDGKDAESGISHLDHERARLGIMR